MSVSAIRNADHHGQQRTDLCVGDYVRKLRPSPASTLDIPAVRSSTEPKRLDDTATGYALTIATPGGTVCVANVVGHPTVGPIPGANAITIGIAVTRRYACMVTRHTPGPAACYFQTGEMR